MQCHTCTDFAAETTICFIACIDFLFMGSIMAHGRIKPYRSQIRNLFIACFNLPVLTQHFIMNSF